MTTTLEETVAELRVSLSPADAGRIATALHTKAEVAARRFLPAADGEIEAAESEANEASQRAENLRAKRQGAIDGLKSQIVALGKLRETIAALQSLQVDAGALAERAVAAFIFNFESPSPRALSEFEAALDRVATLPPIQKTLAKTIADFEKQAAQLGDSIRVFSSAEKIDLANFVFGLKQASGLQGNEGHPSAFIGHPVLHKMFGYGFLDELENRD